MARQRAAPEAASPGGAIEPDVTLALPEAREKWNHELERKYLVALLARHEGNAAAAARAAGVGRIHFYRRLWKLGIR
jgi:transcriptional regulator of acetoin/glycerol metabolism